MCQATTHIRFCTCAPAAARKLRHYWVWEHLHQDQPSYILGEPMMPDHFWDQEYKGIQQLLVQALAQPNAFDRALAFAQDDRLHVVLNDGHKTLERSFLFEFQDGSWQASEYSTDMLQYHTTEEAQGKLLYLRKAMNDRHLLPKQNEANTKMDHI